MVKGDRLKLPNTLLVPVTIKSLYYIVKSSINVAKATAIAVCASDSDNWDMSGGKEVYWPLIGTPDDWLILFIFVII